MSRERIRPLAERWLCIAIAQGNQVLFLEWTLGLFGVLLLAVLVDMTRRRIQKVRYADVEWRKAEQLAKRKGVADDAWVLFRGVVERCMPMEPLRAVTELRAFEECVEFELATLEAGGDQNAYEEMGALLRRLRTRLGLDHVPFGQQIRSTRELSPRQPLWVSAAEDTSPQWFQARVAEVTEAHFAIIPKPGGGGAPPTLTPGQDARCHMWREEDARYMFVATLLRFEPNPPTWVFLHTAELNRIQSRDYYRAHVDQTTTVAVLAAHRGDLDVADRPVRTRLEGRVTSLSGGGLAVIVDQAVAVDMEMRVGLKLPGEPPIHVYVRAISDEPIGSGRHRIRGAFEEMTDETRERITHYVSQRQQMLLASEIRLEEGTPQ